MTTIITKNSSTASAVPTASDLVQGELAVNVADKRIFTENASAAVVELGTNPSSLTLPNGTVNGLAFLNASKVLTTGSALQFDGTNLGLGVTPSAWNSANKVLQFAYAGTVAGGTTLDLYCNAYVNSGGTSKYIDSYAYASKYTQYNGAHQWHNTSSTQGAGNTVTWSQAMTLDASGNLLVGTTSRLSSGVYGNNEIRASQGNGGAAALVVYETSGLDASTSINAIKSSTTTSSSQRFLQFYANAGATAMGGIVGNGASNVQFASLSDAREKTNIQSISGSLAKINSLRPVEFDWIADGSHVPAGFVAQEVETVFPEFVVENMSNDGQEERKGLTGGMTGGIIAHLVKAIQEQQAMIEQLKADVAALKAA